MTTETRVRAARDLHRFLASAHVFHNNGALCAALDDIGRFVPFDCATVIEWDGAAGRHSTSVNRHFPDYCLQHWEGQVHHEPSFLRLHIGAPVLRVRDIPVPERSSELFEQTYDRAGFDDGLTLRLWTSDGRFHGTLIANAVGTRRFDDLTVDLLEMIAPRLAALLDPVSDLAPLPTELIEGQADGLFIDRTGRVRRLTEDADDELARPGGPLWSMVSSVAVGRLRENSAIVLIGDRLLAVSLHAGRHGVLLLHRTAPPPFGLSTRELQILNALADGATNGELAARFGIATRTVATYVERILVKTGCPNRTAATRLATRINLTVC